jgi:hypothetical protein
VIEDEGLDQGKSILEFFYTDLTYRDWCEIHELIKYRGSLWFAFEYNSLISPYSWSPWFAILMEKLCPRDYDLSEYHFLI